MKQIKDILEWMEKTIKTKEEKKKQKKKQKEKRKPRLELLKLRAQLSKFIKQKEKLIQEWEEDQIVDYIGNFTPKSIEDASKDSFLWVG